MILTPRQLEELKKAELDILVAVVDVCERLHLRYYLLCGTLLGAVRHQGFIPWDDDIDIGMMREDYTLFLEKAPSMLPKHLFLQTIWTDPGYMACFAKVRNNNTTFVENTVSNRSMHHGVFIDIFPLDYYPENVKEQKRLQRRKKRYEHRLISEYVMLDLKLKHKLYYTAYRLLYPSLRNVLKKRERMFCAVPKSAMVADYGGYLKETAPIEWYGEGVPIWFEGLQLRAPAEYDKLLTQIYGDYMIPPPEEQREGHHYVQAFDLEKPYTEYVKDYRKGRIELIKHS